MGRPTGRRALLFGFLLTVVGLTTAGASAANPKGNNGTIKIDGVTLQDGPSNEPHVACAFALEFSGYDKGDLKATVTFSLQAPTLRRSGSQVLATDTLAIGEDPAGGAGDLDAAKLYTLDLTGVSPHGQQGYHVKVTVHADGSKGADTKHKVFWVQPCPTPTTTTTTTTTTTSSSSSTTTTTTTATTATTVPTTSTTVTAPSATTTTAAPQVLGETATTTTAPPQVLGEQTERPTGPLPRTGSGVGTTAAVGLTLLAAGRLLQGTRRHTPTTADGR
ncbi:MAG TPA: hypothetical protein VHL53_15840 [Acidimicrobiia bacterium]|nr:hypothetical protein [Acidimicrobiia bacterium]